MNGPGDLIVIFGPTATGKSELAFHLARRMGGRVINADSIQVYRGLDAGSCKPPERARRDVPHEMIDIADPSEPFSAGRFAREATRCISTCRAAGEVPIVAGGTGLYLRALLQGIAPMPPRDEELRQRLYARSRDTSKEALHDELRRLDPETAGRLGRRDLHRVVRALEVLDLTGVPMSRHIQENAFRPGALPALKIGLTMERSALYRRVDDRVERIFQAGIVEEVRALREELRGGVVTRAMPGQLNAAETQRMVDSWDCSERPREPTLVIPEVTNDVHTTMIAPDLSHVRLTAQQGSF